MKKIVMEMGNEEILAKDVITTKGIILAEGRMYSYIICPRDDGGRKLSWYWIDGNVNYPSSYETLEKFISMQPDYRFTYFDTFEEFCKYWITRCNKQ